MEIKEIFTKYNMEYNEAMENIMIGDSVSLLVPNKIEAKLAYITKKDLQLIHKDVTTAKDLIMILVKNFNSTFASSLYENASQDAKEGWKRLNSVILESQVGYKPTKTYKAILDLLINNGIIEKKKEKAIKGEKSLSYRLSDAYFGKGFTKYTLTSKIGLKKHLTSYTDNLDKVVACPIAQSELVIRPFITFPTQDETRNFLIEKAKEGFVNKRGMKLVYLNKRNRNNFPNSVFVEDYVEMMEYLSKITVPIVADNAGGRVITTFNMMPSVLRELVKLNGRPLIETDYTCLHPNINNKLNLGSGKHISHDIVAKELGIDRKEAKIGHLTYFNLPVVQMVNHKLHTYYVNNEPTMIECIIATKNANGYKHTAYECFQKETELMRKNFESFRKEGIQALYVFDAVYTEAHNEAKVKSIMNRNAKSLGINTKA